MIDLKKIFDGVETSFKIKKEINLSKYKLNEQEVFLKPIKIIGKVENIAGVVHLSYHADGEYNLICDRCLDNILVNINKTYKHLLVDEASIEESLLANYEEDYIICIKGILKITDLVASDIILNVNIKNLCKEDCKGLCGSCGQNLNERQCDCKTDFIDPRLAKLQELLK